MDLRDSADVEDFTWAEPLAHALPRRRRPPIMLPLPVVVEEFGAWCRYARHDSWGRRETRRSLAIDLVASASVAGDALKLALGDNLVDYLAQCARLSGKQAPSEDDLLWLGKRSSLMLAALTSSPGILAAWSDVRAEAENPEADLLRLQRLIETLAALVDATGRSSEWTLREVVGALLSDR